MVVRGDDAEIATMLEGTEVGASKGRVITGMGAVATSGVAVG